MAQKPFVFSLVAVFAVALLATHANAALVGFEAEDGSSATTTVTASLGADYDPPLSDAGALGDQYITPETEFLATSNPGSADKVASYAVTFAEAGTYDLYARLYIGPGGADDAATPGPGNDDSFYYGNGFGSKDVSNGGDWITVNGLPDAGSDVPSEQYVWVNLSENSGAFGESEVTFTVASPGVETIQFGAREDGLRLDAFAFGTSTDTFTDAQLNAAVVPEPASLALVALGGLALLRRRR